jgi:hypothetical protein
MNNSGAPVAVSSLILNWDYAEDLGEMMGGTSRNLYLDYIRFGGTTRWGGTSGANDSGSPTDTTADSPSSWSSPTLAAGSTTVMLYRFANTWSGYGTDGKLLGSDYGLTVYLDNGCVLEREAVERELPEVDCDLYTISSPTLLNNGIVQFVLRNNDSYAANVSSIRATWDYLEDFFEIVVSPSDTSVRADWITYKAGSAGDPKVWGSGNDDGVNDYESPTDTLVDVPWSWPTTLPKFDPNIDYYMQVDFDRNDQPTTWLTDYGLIPSDFGALINFDNGCVLELPAIPRPLVTPTPNCDLIYSTGAYISGDDFRIGVRNDNFAPAYLTNSTLVWPTTWSSSMYFNYVSFNGSNYWDPPNIYYSPVSTVVPRVAINGRSSAVWANDFNEWPSVPATGGLFSGDLLFDYNGLACPVYDDLMVYPTPTRTSTSTATQTSTATSTGTATNTRTPTNTGAPTDTATNTFTPTDTGTATNTATITDTPTITNTPRPSDTKTNTPTNTFTPTGTPPTPTLTPTICLTPPDMGGCH